MNHETMTYPSMDWNENTDPTTLTGYQSMLHLILGQLPVYLFLFGETFARIVGMLTSAPRFITVNFAMNIVVEPLVDVMTRCKETTKRFASRMLRVNINLFPEEQGDGHAGSATIAGLPQEARVALRTIGIYLRIFDDYIDRVRAMINQNAADHNNMVSTVDLESDMDDMTDELQDVGDEYRGDATF